MSQWILPDIKSIAEFGCGDGKLKNFLRQNVKYIGIDYVKRNDETIVCDVNKDTLPKLDVDAVFASGFLVYILKPEKFLEYIASLKLKQFILSYHPLELRTGKEYRYGLLRAVSNFFTTGELICMIQKKTGLILEQSKICLTYPDTVLFDFRKTN